MEADTPDAIEPEMPVEHFVYSDGLSSLSVFVEELKAGAEPLAGRDLGSAWLTWDQPPLLL